MLRALKKEMTKQKLFSFIILTGMIAFYSCSIRKAPTDSEGRPLIVKLGTIVLTQVETDPVVFNNKVFRFEFLKPTYQNNTTGDTYFRFVERETGKATKSFAKGFHFGSAYVFNDTAYVTAPEINGGEQVHIFASNDLENWDHWLAFELPDWRIWNTSLIKVENIWVLMFEIAGKDLGGINEAGISFTARFATSTDLKKWEILPSDHNYARDRYTAPHFLRYLDGYYYNFYLEAHDGYEQRIVRSKNLIEWEPSPLNPVLKASAEDKQIADKNLPEELQQKIAGAPNFNNSDISFCEYNGKLIINYAWGNQQDVAHLAEAYYEGTMEQFLRGWFPDK